MLVPALEGRQRMGLGSVVISTGKKSKQEPHALLSEVIEPCIVAGRATNCPVVYFHGQFQAVQLVVVEIYKDLEHEFESLRPIQRVRRIERGVVRIICEAETAKRDHGLVLVADHN